MLNQKRVSVDSFPSAFGPFLHHSAFDEEWADGGGKVRNLSWQNYFFLFISKLVFMPREF